MLTFHHYSKERRAVLDPKYCGSAKQGKEKLRAAVPSICLYHPEGEVEREFIGYVLHVVYLPDGSLYDLSADLSNYLRGGDFSLTERRIKRAGYWGYWLPTGLGLFKGQARLYRKVTLEH